MKYRRQSNTVRFDEEPFRRNARKKANIFFKKSLILNFLQTKPQVKSLIKNF